MLLEEGDIYYQHIAQENVFDKRVEKSECCIENRSDGSFMLTCVKGDFLAYNAHFTLDKLVWPWTCQSFYGVYFKHDITCHLS